MTIAHIRACGYDFPTLVDLAQAEAEDLINLWLTTTVQPDDLLRRWCRDSGWLRWTCGVSLDIGRSSTYSPPSSTPETIEALGKHLPDEKLAEAVRKAALKHRSWMANRHR